MSTIEHYQQGMTAFAARRFEEAVPHLQAASGATCRGNIARYYLGQAHALRGRELLHERRWPDAASHLSAAARLTPAGRDLSAFLVQCYVRGAQFDLAAIELDRLLARDPDQIDVRVRLAMAHHQAGEPYRALHILRDGLTRRPESAELRYQLGIMTASLGDLAEATEHFGRAAKADPSHTRTLERLAQCCSVAGRHERALSYLQQAHAIDPGHARIAWQLAILAGQTQNPIVLTEPIARNQPAALERLADAIVSEPDFVEAFLSLPVSQVDQEVFSTLADTLQCALRTHPEYADLHFHCGRVYRRLNRGDEAIAHAERAVRINPRYVSALVLLADLYAQTDRCEEGLARLEAAINAGGDYPDLHYMMGQLCQKVGEPSRAKEAYTRALMLNENYPAAREALACLAA